MPKLQSLTLKNGLKIFFVRVPSAPSATIILTAKVGSKHEKKSLNGISHFVEHLAFKGTKNRPQPGQIAYELDGLGASYNASTSQERTLFYVKAQPQFFNQAVEIASDMYVHPIYRPEEVEKEKGVIIEEINMYEDLPQAKVERLFLELLYGDQPAGWDIAGTKETVSRLTQKQLFAFRKRYYTARNSFVLLAGNFSPSRAKNIISRDLSQLAKGVPAKLPPVKERQTRPQSLVYKKPTDQTHLIVGFRAFSVFDKRLYPAKVLAAVLGNGMGSRLFKRVRDELGAAYYVSASADLFSDCGTITASAGVKNQKAPEVLEAILEEFARLAKEKPKPEELVRAKNYLSGMLMLSLEKTDSLGMFYNEQIATGLKIKSPAEVIKQVNQVTADQILRLAREIFLPETLNLSAVGPVAKNKFNAILKKYRL